LNRSTQSSKFVIFVNAMASCSSGELLSIRA